MATTVDLRGAVVAHYARGHIESKTHQRLLALPATWVVRALEHCNDQEAAALGESLAAALDPAVRSALGDGDERDAASPEQVAYALSIALASHGLGLASLERWGDALVVKWHDVPSAKGPWLIAASTCVAMLLRSITGSALDIVPVGVVDGALRMLIADPEAAHHVRQRSEAGDALGAIVASLEVVR